MRVSRLFLPQSLCEGEIATLSEEPAHYLRTVLRLRVGAELIVFNGQGGEFSATIAALHRTGGSLEIGDWRNRDLESALHIHLGLGISRGERMDLVVQKAVELGVLAITPLITERCVVRLQGEREKTRLEHWRKVTLSACEQCGRNVPPRIGHPRLYAQWLGEVQGLKLLLDPGASLGLKEFPRPPDGAVVLLSGPEGGFTPSEHAQASAAGFSDIRLGPRILRTETAAIAALTALQTLWGDLG